MKLTEQDIAKFQSLYKQSFGIQLNKKEALEKGILLLRSLELIYKPMSVDQFQRLQKRREELMIL